MTYGLAERNDAKLNLLVQVEPVRVAEPHGRDLTSIWSPQKERDRERAATQTEESDKLFLCLRVCVTRSILSSSFCSLPTISDLIVHATLVCKSDIERARGD